jgi:copper(I)-binding protein
VVKGIRTANTARRAAAIAIAGAAAAALSACGAGHETQTDLKVSAIAGVNVDADGLALRDLQVEFDSAEGYAAGDAAALRVWIGNEGTSDISLVGVETEAGTVTFVSPAAQAAEEAAEAASPSEDAGETAAAGATETPSEAATTAEEDPFEGETTFDIPIAASEYVRLDEAVEDGDYLLIEDLADDLKSGDTVEVVFLFSNGQEVAAQLPIGQDLTGEEDRSYFEPEEEAEGH